MGPMANVQQEAVALWKFLESRGFQPSVRSIGRILREELGLKFREHDLRGWLSKFRDASGTQKPTEPDAKIEHTGRSSSKNGTQPGRGFARADNVSLISETISPTERAGRGKAVKQTGLDLGITTVPVVDHDAPKAKRPEVEIMDACWPIVEADYIGGTKRWYPANVRTAKAFAEKGITPEQVVNALQAMRTGDFVGFHGTNMLATVAKHWGRYGNAKPAGPRTDSCGCEVPAGVEMPILRPGEKAHYAGDGDWIIDSEAPPPMAVR